MKRIIIGTAGHIDHGKTALVKALTGVDTDRLPEEKRRGITIDLGFAHTKIGGTEVSFIDVPGHERFVKNMLAGIGGVDLLMLIVAADESVMPQTREHFQICRLLNIPAGIVVITKSDLVDSDTIEIAKQEISDLVKGSFLERAPVIAVSSRTGEGIDQLKKLLHEQFHQLKERHFDGIFRLPIDRIFTLKGHGTVITGTMISGSITKDATVEILPSNLRARVRSIHAHDTQVDVAHAGQRTAVNLQGIEKDQIVRGDVLTVPDFFKSSSLLDVQITLLSDSRPLPHNALIRFHHLATDVLARTTILGSDVLQPGETAFAQLRLQHPVFALHGDRFILRQHSPLITAGGGIILDHLPVRRISKGDLAAADRLKALLSATDTERLSIAVQQKGIAAADEKYLKAKLALKPGEILQLRSSEVIFLKEKPVLAIAAASERKITARMIEIVSEFHKKHPLLQGIQKEELRSRHFAVVPSEVFSAILDRAVAANQLQITKDLVGIAGRVATLTTQEESLAESVESAIIAHGLGFPGFESLSKELKQPTAKLTEIVYLLVRQNKIMKVADDYFLHRKIWDKIKQQVRSLKAAQKTFSVPDFKERFGISRKYAIPLLEQLDREGITRRSGNERIII